jgi:hypothetical protein
MSDEPRRRIEVIADALADAGLEGAIAAGPKGWIGRAFEYADGTRIAVCRHGNHADHCKECDTAEAPG